MNRRKLQAAAFAALMMLLTAFNQTAHAGSWSWDDLLSFFSFDDSVVCATDQIVDNNGDSGAGTLRQAVMDACAGGTIRFVNTVTGTIQLGSGQIVIDKNLTIQGPGKDLLRVNNVAAMGANSRIFFVNSGVTAAISGLSISGGNLLGGNGGGIYNAGNLTVTNSNVSSNNVRGGASGGGIYSESGTLNVTNTTISGNGAVNGGGIFNSGTLNLIGSSLTNNSSINFGGGLYNLGSSATITSTTVSGNRTLDGPPSPTPSGAGIYARGGTLTLANSTVAFNTTFSNGVGGGIYIEATVNSRNSIIAANSAVNGPDISGTLASQGNNLIGSTAGASIAGVTTGNIINTNALLATLADNGGLTQTHALLSGSPAINAGNTATSPNTDQRNAPRVGAADIGAFEFNSTAPIPTPSPTITPTPTPTPSPSPTPTPCTSTPTSEKIAFSSFRDGVGQIYTMNTDGTNQTRLTFSSGHDRDPSFSADGRRIVFSSERDGNPEIYVMNADGANQTRLTNNNGDDHQPSFSPDGSRIVFSSSRNGEYQIFVMNADGSNIVRLTPLGLGDRRPKFSPDGSKIAFDSYRTNYAEHIYVMNADGTNQTKLTNYSNTDRQPSFSPDGSQIVFAAYRNGFGVGIHSMNADGSNQVPINGDIPDQSNYEPTFSPDGGRIAFSSNGDIYVMNADGSNQTRLTNTSLGNGGHPSWGRQTNGIDCNNTAPLAAAESFGVPVNTTLTTPSPGVLVNDTDGESNALTAQLQTSPSYAQSFILNTDGSFTYLPYSGFIGTDSFTYRAWDGNSSSNTVTVTITVYQPNYAPYAGDDFKTTDENTTLIFSVSDLTTNDGTGPGNESDQTLTVTTLISTANTHGAVSLNNGQITYQPAANYNGAASFDYQVCDNGTTNGQPDPKCATATVNVTVNADNNAPVANGGSISTNEDTPSSAFTLTGSDADNDSLTFEIVTAPVNGTYNQTTGVYTPNGNANGGDSFTFIARDSVSQSAAATVSITINAVNDAPTAAGQSVTTDEDAAKTITLSGGDVDGNALTYPASQPLHGSVSCTGVSCLYTPTANYNGADSFTFKTNDGQTDSAAATISITVNPINDAPTANAQLVTTDEDTAKAFTLTGSDPDGANTTLAFAIVNQPAHGTLAGTGANQIYTPAANFSGADSFTFRVSDGGLDSATATISMTVTAVNDNPDAVNDSATLTEDGGANTVNVLSNDGIAPDTGETLTVSSITNGANGAVTVTGGGSNVSYTPNANYFGADSFTYTISDGNGGSDTATVNITVTSVNDDPTAANDAATVAEDSGINALGVLGNDGIAPDTGETLVITAVTQGANGAAAVTNGGANVSYTPAANFFGADSFTYTISDGNGGTASGTVNVTVTAVNDAPTISSGAIIRQQNAGGANSSVAAVLDIDDAENNLVVTVNNAASATVNGVTVSNFAVSANGTVTADVAAACGASNAAFTLKVTDPGNLSATAVFSVTVTIETTAPVIAAIANVAVNLPAGSTATSKIVSFPLPTATDNCGAVTVTTNPDSGSIFPLGVTIVMVTATDSSGNQATATFTVTVLYNFTGFFQPVDNLPIVNIISAGQAVSVKFSLAGNQGLNVVAAGYPISTPVACDATEPGSTIEETINAGGSSLSYNAATDQYGYIWKTNKAWRGTCRMFVLKLADGSEHYAKFSFR